LYNTVSTVARTPDTSIIMGYFKNFNLNTSTSGGLQMFRLDP